MLKVRTLVGVATLQRDKRHYTRQHVYNADGVRLGYIEMCEGGGGWIHSADAQRYYRNANRAVENLLRVSA